MRIDIEEVTNGYTVSYNEGDSESIFKEKIIVFEVDDDESNKQKQLKNMFYSILDILGEHGSRYDKERLYIEIKPGDKYEED